MLSTHHNVTLPHITIEDRFEGPLDELLDLIQARRLPVSVVSLARITDTYLASLQERTLRSLDEMVLVLWIVATLLYVKARALIPANARPEDEEEQLNELTLRLHALTQLRTCGEQLGQRWGRGQPVRLAPHKAPVQPHTPQLLSRLTTQSLHQAVQRLAKRLELAQEQPTSAPRPTVRVQPSLTLAQAIERIASQLQRGFSWQFRVQHYHREDAIVLFLAILELVRRDVVEVTVAHDSTTLTVWGRGSAGSVL